MKKKLRRYVSLGDSIATGTLTPFSQTTSYVFYLARKFREKGIDLDVRQLAHNGDTSQALLWKLTHVPGFRETVAQADYLTVSIGGNDLMRACSIPGFASINTHAARQGAEGFIRNFPKIVEEIRQLNGHGELVVLNLYNPYNHRHRDRGLHEIADEFLHRMNDTIERYTENSCCVPDVYTAFKRYVDGEMGRVTCLYPADSLLRNPHPTPYGQRLIADLVMEQWAHTV